MIHRSSLLWLATSSLAAFSLSCASRRLPVRTPPGPASDKDRFEFGGPADQTLNCEVIKPDGTTLSSKVCDCQDLASPQVSKRRVMIKEGGKVVEYIIINEPVPTEIPDYPWAKGLITLVRREYGEKVVDGVKKKGPTETKVFPVSDCFGRAERIATDGKSVYVVFERAQLRNQPGFIYVGKVMKKGDTTGIAFFRRESPPSMPRVDTVRIALQDGRLYLAVGWKGKFDPLMSPLAGDETPAPVPSQCGGL